MAENKNESPTLSRRKFLRFSAFSAATILASCASPPKPTPEPFGPKPQPTKKEQLPLSEQRKINHLQLDNQANRPLMPEKDFMRIDQAMEKSSSSFLKKMGKDVSKYWTAFNNPPDTPTWISEVFTPLVITYDYDQISFANSILKFGDKTSFILIAPDKDNPGKTKKIEYFDFEPVKLGIHLGSPQFSRDEGSTIEGCYLAKEWINITSLISVARRLVDFGRGQQQMEFVSPTNNVLITDQQAKERAGISFFLNSIQDKTETSAPNAAWILFDGLPILIIATQMTTLVSQKEIPSISRGAIPFFLAANLLNKPENNDVRSRILDFVNNWEKSGSVYPPINYLDLMFEPKVKKIILELQEKILTQNSNKNTLF